MNNQLIEAREFIAQAREALRRGEKASARQLGEQAALLAPEMEDAWLILAASDPDPQDALEYAKKALELSPQSTRASRAVEWAAGRVKQVQALKDSSPVSPLIVPRPADAVTGLPQKQTYKTAVAAPALRPQRRNWLLPALLTGLACMLVGFLALFLLTRPALASLVNNFTSAAAPTQETLWAPVDIAKPEGNVNNVDSPVAQAADTPTSVPTEAAPTSVPTDMPTLIPTAAPTDAPTEVPSAIPAATETPATLAMEIVEDTPTSEYVAPDNSAQQQYPSSGNGERWIDVDLTNQMVYAYEGDVVVNAFVVSTGTWLTPTVTGQYKVYVKYRSASMSGPGYYLPDVPYIMYFYKSYGLHGTYWHNNFGTPMSHGCVNLRTDEAAWLFNWASVGTMVNVHY